MRRWSELGSIPGEQQTTSDVFRCPFQWLKPFPTSTSSFGSSFHSPSGSDFIWELCGVRDPLFQWELCLLGGAAVRAPSFTFCNLFLTFLSGSPGVCSSEEPFLSGAPSWRDIPSGNSRCLLLVLCPPPSQSSAGQGRLKPWGGI